MTESQPPEECATDPVSKELLKDIDKMVMPSAGTEVCTRMCLYVAEKHHVKVEVVEKIVSERNGETQ